MTQGRLSVPIPADFLQADFWLVKGSLYGLRV